MRVSCFVYYTSDLIIVELLDFGLFALDELTESLTSGRSVMDSFLFFLLVPIVAGLAFFITPIFSSDSIWT